MSSILSNPPRCGDIDQPAKIQRQSNMDPSMLDTQYFFFGSHGISGLFGIITDDRSASLPSHLRRRIDELSSLSSNWDGEGAKKIKTNVISDVVEALKCLMQLEGNFREPFLAPTFDGFVQIEWHGDKRSLEIEAVETGWLLVGTMATAGGERQYFSADCGISNFERLGRFYYWFIGTEMLWPSL